MTNNFLIETHKKNNKRTETKVHKFHNNSALNAATPSHSLSLSLVHNKIKSIRIFNSLSKFFFKIIVRKMKNSYAKNKRNDQEIFFLSRKLHLIII